MVVVLPECSSQWRGWWGSSTFCVAVCVVIVAFSVCSCCCSGTSECFFLEGKMCLKQKQDVIEKP